MNKKGILTLQSFDGSVINISLTASNPDTLIFADGAVSASYDRNNVMLDQLKLQLKTPVDLANAGNNFNLDDSIISEVMVDDEDLSLPLINFDSKIVSLDEGNSGTTKFEFNIDRSGNIKNESSVKYEIKYSDEASANDFSNKTTGYLTFKPNESSNKIVLDIVGDNVVETDEAFQLVLSNPTNAILGKVTTAQGIILNDDKSNVVNNTTNNSSSATANTNTVSTNPDISIVDGVTVYTLQTDPSEDVPYDLGSLNAGKYEVSGHIQNRLDDYDYFKFDLPQESIVNVTVTFSENAKSGQYLDNEWLSWGVDAYKSLKLSKGTHLIKLNTDASKDPIISYTVNLNIQTKSAIPMQTQQPLIEDISSEFNSGLIGIHSTEMIY